MWITGISISADSRNAPRWKSEKMRKPAWYARTLLRARPFAMQPAACSRTPKCRLRPARSCDEKCPAPSNVNAVLVEGARSAAPPSSHGTRDAMALSTAPDASRPARPLSLAGKTGMSASQSSGSVRCCIRSSWSARSGCSSR